MFVLQKYEAVLEEEPDLKVGVAAALKMASMKGMLFKQGNLKISVRILTSIVNCLDSYTGLLEA